VGAVHAASLGRLTFRVFFAYARLMGLNIGGYQDQPDWAEDGSIAADRDVPGPSHSDGALVSQVWRHNRKRYGFRAGDRARRASCRPSVREAGQLSSEHFPKCEEALVSAGRRRSTEVTSGRRYNRQ
jgi:hypothetical protein